jgi:hypothetical protein
MQKLKTAGQAGQMPKACPAVPPRLGGGMRTYRCAGGTMIDSHSQQSAVSVEDGPHRLAAEQGDADAPSFLLWSPNFHCRHKFSRASYLNKN